jgi:hypothetical protein
LSRKSVHRGLENIGLIDRITPIDHIDTPRHIDMSRA